MRPYPPYKKSLLPSTVHVTALLRLPGLETPAVGLPPQSLRGPHAQGGSAAALGPAQTHKRKAAEALDLRQKLGRMQ